MGSTSFLGDAVVLLAVALVFSFVVFVWAVFTVPLEDREWSDL